MEKEHYFEKLFFSLERIQPVSASMKVLLTPLIELRAFAKDATLLYEGGIQMYLWYIVKGFAREYRQDPSPGKEITEWFWQTGDFVFNEHFFSLTKSSVSIDFYRGTDILEVDIRSVIGHAHLTTEIRELESALMLDHIGEKQRYFHDLADLTRIAHVAKFYNSHKLLFGTAFQKDLASFLHIKDKSLYRYLRP